MATQERPSGHTAMKGHNFIVKRKPYYFFLFTVSFFHTKNLAIQLDSTYTFVCNVNRDSICHFIISSWRFTDRNLLKRCSWPIIWNVQEWRPSVVTDLVYCVTYWCPPHMWKQFKVTVVTQPFASRCFIIIIVIIYFDTLRQRAKRSFEIRMCINK